MALGILPLGGIGHRVPESIPEGIMERFHNKALPVVVNHRGKELDLNEHVIDVEIREGTIYARIKCNEQGATASPFSIFAALMGESFDPSNLNESSRRYLIRKLSIEF